MKCNGSLTSWNSFALTPVISWLFCNVIPLIKFFWFNKQYVLVGFLAHSDLIQN